MAEDATAHHAQDDDWTQVASSGHEVAQPTPAKPWSNQKEKEESYLVKFEEGDVENPMNWSSWYRWFLTAAGGILVLNATFASSAPSGVAKGVMTTLGMGQEVFALTVALFVAGYCVGPVFWGPLSEQYGRRPISIISFLVLTGFQVGCALAPNTGAMLVFRFLGGCFAAAPLTNSGGILGDIWPAKNRGKSMVVFSVAPFAGPSLGPIVSGYIATSGTDWRWLFWVLTIFSGVCLAITIFLIPETYAPILLVRKAAKLRKSTGDERYYAPLEANKMPLAKRLQSILAKPFVLLAREPMLIAITLYMSFLYGCLYLLFEAYPIVFTQGHHMSAGASGLMFLPITCGTLIGVVLYLVFFEPRYERAVEEHHPHFVPPEYRLGMTFFGAPLFAVGCFWFGWTSYPSISYWSPLLAGGLLGLSIFMIFLSLLNYLIDTYLFVAASALAAMTVVRSVFGAAFPLFATQMYEKLGPRWASSLLGFIALAMTPIPWALSKYGPTLRSRSTYAPDVPRRPPPPKDEMV